MESTNLIQNTNFLNYQINNITLSQVARSNEIAGDETFYQILTSEGCDSFLNYIGWLGLINDPNTIILSSKHHYYYDPEELRTVNTIINLKELNQIKQIKDFLHSVSNALQRSSNFIGYFTDNKQHNSLKSNVSSSDSNTIEFLSTNPFLSMIYNIMDSRINKYMSKKNVRLLLQEYGFKVLDMTDLDGLTYFHAQVA
jgi:hypothetical protein